MAKVILQEADETTVVAAEEVSVTELPASLVTSLISKGWDEVGMLKAEIEDITKNFTGGEALIEALQELSDAYLIHIGKLEGILAKKDIIVTKEEESETTEQPVAEPAVEVPAIPEVAAVEVEESIEEEVKEDKKLTESWDYFCDFDDPVGEPTTDADIYTK